MAVLPRLYYAMLAAREVSLPVKEEIFKQIWSRIRSTEGLNNDGIPPITAPWPVKDIAYVSLLSIVLMAAFLEWFLWLAAFEYCLWKVFQKADNWSIATLSVIQMVLFFVTRGIFLPIMVVTLPLPAQITQYFPEQMVGFLQWFAFWSFAVLLIVPWLFCVFQLVTKDLGRKQKVKTILDEYSAPKTVIVMPVYKEKPDVLVTAINSVVDCEYPASCIHVFLSFDGDEEDETFLRTMEMLGVPLGEFKFPTSFDVTYKHARITVSKFKHGGKRHAQKLTFKLVDHVYAEYLQRNDDLFILFIDSDCILDKLCLQNFMYDMELKPSSKRSMLAMTGIITCTTERNSFITVLQDMEYIHGQLFERSVESGCGAVTCLPGALTMLRFSAFRKMAKYYFADKAEQCDDLFDYGKCHLGEDRWLTHLFMIGAKQRYQIQLCTSAFCKTEAVQTYRSLMKQRRRWFLGFITNEVCMLTDARVWRKYPLLCIVRFMQNTIRTTALLFFIMCISIMTTSNKIGNLPVGFIAVSLGLNWLLMLYFGAKLRRYKIWLYPLMFMVNPFFNWAYMVYGIFTAGQRTWGGPRADAGEADSETTPEEVVEFAEEKGDELNVNVASFRRYLMRKFGRVATVPVQPTGYIEGRFAPAEQGPGGYYHQSNDSGITHGNMLPRNPILPHIPRRSRDSLDSLWTDSSTSVVLPLHVESLMGAEDRKKYRMVQRLQSEFGNAYVDSISTRTSQSEEDCTQLFISNDPFASPLTEQFESHNDAQLLATDNDHAGSASRRSGRNSPSFRPIPPSSLASELRNKSTSDIAIPALSHNPRRRLSIGSRSRRSVRSRLAKWGLIARSARTEREIELDEPQLQSLTLQIQELGTTNTTSRKPGYKLSKKSKEGRNAN